MRIWVLGCILFCRNREIVNLLQSSFSLFVIHDRNRCTLQVFIKSAKTFFALEELRKQKVISIFLNMSQENRLELTRQLRTFRVLVNLFYNSTISLGMISLIYYSLSTCQPLISSTHCADKQVRDHHPKELAQVHGVPQPHRTSTEFARQVQACRQSPSPIQHPTTLRRRLPA